MKHIITGRRQQSTNASASLIAKWSHLEKQIREILSQIYKFKIKRQYKFQFTVLKSLLHVPNQSVHCDYAVYIYIDYECMQNIWVYQNFDYYFINKIILYI